MSIHQEYRKDIDGLRALAILSVVLFHYFPGMLHGGYVGVDVFFVISGYLITSIIVQEISSHQFSFIDFYAKRIRRIFPALILVLIFCYAVGWNRLLAEDYMSLGKHMASSAAFITNFILYRETGYFDTASELKPLLHLWSLGVEEQFYIFWPLLMWTLHKKPGVYINLITLVFLISFTTNMVLSITDPMAAFYLPYGRFWELMAGAVIANFRFKHSFSNSAVTGNFQAAIGLILLVSSMVFFNNHLKYPYYYALLPVSGTFLLINASPSSWINRNILSSKLLGYIGLISYPLYLWHWPLISFYRLEEGDDIHILEKIGLLVTSFLLASFTYHFIEKKVRNGLNLYPKVYFLFIVMMITGYIGYNDYARDGLDFRVKHIVSTFTDTQFDLKTSWREHTCFLLDTDTHFSDRCITAGDGKLILVYGDSFAASLSPGLSDYLHATKYRFGQLTTSGCPPLSREDSVSERCKNANESALDVIKREQPYLLILNSNWTQDTLDKLPDLIRTLQRDGVQHMEIVGIFPKWQGSLPRVYFRYYKKFHSILPSSTRFGLANNLVPDQNVHAVATALHVDFFSAYALLCQPEGCLTRVGSGKGSITTLDEAHITPAAAAYIARPLLSHWVDQ